MKAVREPWQGPYERGDDDWIREAGATGAARHGCGDDDASAPAGEKGSTQGAKVAPTLAESKDATGTVTFCAGKDNSGGYHSAVERFNERYEGQGLSARLVEFPNGSD